MGGLLGRPGPLVASADVGPEDWLSVLPASRHPLVLAPSSERGWFDGTALIGADPVDDERFSVEAGLTEAGARLAAAMSSHDPVVTAALIDYDGSARVTYYRGGVVRGPDGWRTWGACDPDTLETPTHVSPLPASEPLALDVTSGMDRQVFEAGVERTRSAIAAGDVYVLNLTYRLTGRRETEPALAFATLLARGASSMSAALLTPDRSIASISPERFLSVRGRRARIEPIKGTRPRGVSVDEDSRQARELAADPKELAEHVMIVDLERNDLGRVCEPGTVFVRPLYEVVPTPYCHQLVSVVHGTLSCGIAIADALEATFPCGSVTGAPKIAAMNHIAEFERSGRGSYCGTLAVAVPGAMDSSVLIRTAQFDGDVVRYGTGGGITCDSVPSSEWEETLVKARPFLGGIPDRTDG